jgi:ABC-type lipoprotein release transport system permease subunit
MLLKLAWKNIFRNKRRTILSGLAIGIGLAALIVYDALIVGIEHNLVKAATDFFPGQAQIHRAGFRNSFETEATINGHLSIIGSLQREKDIKAFAPRAIGYAMITSPTDVGSVMLYGIDPDREKEVSDLSTSINSGQYLNNLDDGKILIGKKLAKNLGVTVGDKIVVTVAQAYSGELSQEMYRVGGIFGFNVSQVDTSFAFIRLKDIQRMLNIKDSIHEISLKFKDISFAGSNDLSFWKKYSQNGNEAVGWNILFHDLDSLMKMTNFSLVLSALLLFGIVALGIINTLFMSLYERMFEFGVLKAIGSRSSRMAWMVVLEACSLAIISIVIGLLIGYMATYILSVVGIDYRGYEFNKVTVKELLYPVPRWYQYWIYPLLVFIFTAFVSLYPAVYAAKLNPAKAMRRSF